MGGFFGAACNHDAIEDVFFGTDYHSHLGTRRGGMAAYDPIKGLQRDIAIEEADVILFFGGEDHRLS